MWNEFQSNTLDLGEESEQLLHDLFTKDGEKKWISLCVTKCKIVPPSGPTEIQTTIKARRGQQFFRQAILRAYGISCCISGINVPRLLVASHIKPWGDFPDDRLNPRNGLCLSNLHDAAFDSGLITLDEQLNVILSRRLKSYFPQPTLEQNFILFEGIPIRLPEKLAEPDPQFLFHHRKHIFKGVHLRKFASDAADVGRVEAGAFGESILCEFAGFAPFADVQPEFGKDRITFRHVLWSGLSKPVKESMDYQSS